MCQGLPGSFSGHLDEYYEWIGHGERYTLGTSEFQIRVRFFSRSMAHCVSPSTLVVTLGESLLDA